MTTAANWNSGSASVAAISSTVGTQGQATILAAGTSTITATYAGASGSTLLTVSPALLESIAVTPASVSLGLLGTQQFAATGTYSDGSTQDITSQVTWASASPTLVSVSPTGMAEVLGYNAGVSITASETNAAGTLITSPAATVAAPAPILLSIAVSASATSLADPGTLQFTATGTYSDGSQAVITTGVTWASSNTAVATITTGGLATSAGAGTSNISASLNGITSPAFTLTVNSPTLVSIAVSASAMSLADPGTLQFSAQGTYSDRSTADISGTVTWASSNTAAATIASGGLATSVAPGTSNITASLNGITSPAFVLTVNPPTLQSIVLTTTQGSTTPATASVANGTSVQLYATGVYSNNSTQDLSTQVSWSSNSPDATVGNTTGSQGLVTGAAVGSATISATLGAVTGTSSVTVTQAILKSIAISPTTIATWSLGQTQQFTAIGTFTDSTTQDVTQTATWSTSNTAVATIVASGTSGGLASSVSQGTITITAAASGVTATTQPFTVGPAALVSIAITPANASIALGTNETFTATGSYTDGSTQNLTSAVTWSATPGTGMATFAANSSVATATAEGTVTITATSTLGTAGTTPLTITAPVLMSIAVTPATAKIYQGGTQQFTATGTFSDNSTQDLTSTVSWGTSNGAVATISTAGPTTGLATGIGGGGPITVSATFGSIVSSTTGGDGNLTVVGITSLVLTPAAPTAYLGDANPLNPVGTQNNTVAFTATVNYSDGTSTNVTTAANWSSGTPAVATISNTVGTQGQATILIAGTSTITATYAGASGSTLLTVSPALLESIALTPTSVSLSLMGTQQFTATGTFSDGTSQDVTAQVSWLSADPSVGIAPGGLATALGYNAGAAITASEINAAGTTIISPSATVLVPAPTLVMITVTPPSISLAAGFTQQFAATGTYSDASVKDVTALVTWGSSDTTLASITSGGLASALKVGMVTISATSGSVVGSTTFTVTAPILQSVAVCLGPYPSSTCGSSTVSVGVTLGLNATQQFSALGIYSDSSTQDLTATATWQAHDPIEVNINSAGLATVIGTDNGAHAITASYGTIGPYLNSNTGWVTASSTLPISCPSPTIDMRILVVNNTAQGYADYPAIQQILNYVGTPYDVVDVSSAAPTLSDGGCHGYYQGVIFAYGGDYYNIGSWQAALISYEQTFGVRQLNWYSAPDPNFGLGYTGTQLNTTPPPTGTGAYTAPFTLAAAPVFFYANTTTPLSITYAAVDLATAAPAAGGALTPLLQDTQGNIVSAIYTLNGQQFLTQTFDSNASLTHDLIVAYGLLNWVTKGVFLGDYHVYATQSIDDFFIDDSEWIPGTACLANPLTLDRTAPDASNLPVFRVNSADMAQLAKWQTNKQADPLLAQFELTIAMNGVGTTGNGDWSGLIAPIISSSAGSGAATFTAQDFAALAGQTVTVTNTTNGGGVLNGTWTITAVTSSSATTPGTTTFVVSMPGAPTLITTAERGVADNPGSATASIADDLTANLQSYQQSFHWMSHTYDHPSTLNGLCQSTPTGTGCGDTDNPAVDDIDLEILTNRYVASDPSATAAWMLDSDPSDAVKQLTFNDFNAANIVTPGVTGLNDPNVPAYLYNDGIRYAVSDTSVATTITPPNNNGPNPSPNVGIVNSYAPGIYEIPRKPNDIFYNVANWADDQAEFDCIYSYYVPPGSPVGTVPVPDPPFNTYNAAQVLDFTSSAFLTNMLMGDMDPEMFHQPDLHFSDNYVALNNAAPSGTIPASVSNFVGTSGTHVSSLLSDTYDLTFSKYEAVYKLPVLTPTQDQLGVLMQNRNSFNLSNVTASIVGANTSSATITITMPTSATVPTAIIPITGLALPPLTPGSEIYGGQNIAHITLTPGQTITFSLK